MSSNRISPNQREALSTVSTITGKQEYLSSTNKFLNVNATASLAGSPIPISGATSAVGVAIVDGSGNQITSFGGGTQYANGAAQATPTGTVALGWDTANVRALSTDNTGKLNILGTVTANAGTNLNTSLLALESGGNLATLAGGVTGSVYQHNTKQINGVAPLMGNGVTGTGSQRVTIASDNTAFSVNAVQSGTWNIGSITTLPTLANVTTVATVSTVTSLSQLAGAAINLNTGAAGTGTLRVVEANDEGKTIKSAGGSVASSGNNTLVAAGTNKLKVFAFSLSTTSTTAVTCIFQSGASGTELWRVVLQAPTSVSTGANLSVALPGYLFATASATLLNLNLSGAQTVHWSASYIDEA